MSELLAKVAEILGAPESLVQRSAEARAEASGNTVDEVLQSWAGGESIASSAPPAAEAPVEEVKEEAPPAAEAPVEEAPAVEIKEVADETVHEVVEQVIEEETVELKKESSLAFIMGVATVAIFTYFFAFSFG